VRTLEASIPEGALLFPWDYRLQYAIRVLSKRLRVETRTLRPFGSFVREPEAGRLSSYAVKHGMRFSPGAPIYLIVPFPVEPRLQALAEPVFGPNGLGARTDVGLERVKTLVWKRSLSPYDDLGLYVIP